MASKLMVFFLIVTICKVHSQGVKGYQNPVSANVRCPGTCNTQALSGQQKLPCLSPNGNTGITACPRLQILPGNKPIQVPQLLEYLQKQCQSQNCGCAPNTCNSCNTCNAVIQGTQTSQGQCKPVQVSSPSLGIQPSLCGPSSVITPPVSAITVPPSACTTVIDCTIPTLLANAVLLLIQKECLESAACCNINQDCTQTLPCAQTQNCYDWTAIQNFLNQQTGQSNGACADLATLVSGLYQNQPAYQQSQACQQSYGDDTTNALIEALEACLGYYTSDVSSNACPYIPEIQFPAEIPAQLVCDYAYVPTSVPVVKFTVQPCNNAADGFLAYQF